MAGLPYNEIRSNLIQLGEAAHKYGYAMQQALDSEDCWLGTWANDDLYVLVQASLAAPEIGRTLIDVHAGGAYGAEPAEGLFQTLCTATWRFDYGGPWARVLQNGSASYGWRSRLPSELFAVGNQSDAFGFLLGMIDSFGASARILASELIPRYGGHLSRADDPQAFPALLAGILPPEE